ncbi:hypothetical protein YC2023_064287 [Brassica napus]
MIGIREVEEAYDYESIYAELGWRFVIKKGRRRNTKRQYLIGLKIMSHIQLKETCLHKKP